MELPTARGSRDRDPSGRNLLNINSISPFVDSCNIQTFRGGGYSLTDGLTGR